MVVFFCLSCCCFGVALWLLFGVLYSVFLGFLLLWVCFCMLAFVIFGLCLACFSVFADFALWTDFLVLVLGLLFFIS